MTKLLSVIFGVSDHESEVRFAKFKMADPRWGTKFLKINRFVANMLYESFWSSWWRISGQIFKIEDGGHNMAETQSTILGSLFWILKIDLQIHNWLPPVYRISCQSVDFQKIRPPFWIHYLQFCKSDLVFVISNPRIPIWWKSIDFQKFDYHIEFLTAILDPTLRILLTYHTSFLGTSISYNLSQKTNRYLANFYFYKLFGIPK